MDAGDMAKALWNEALLPAAEKMIPQGAAELSQALFNGSGYVPYGATERPIPMEQEGGSIYGSPQASQEMAPTAPEPQVSYDELKQQVAVQSQEVSREEPGLER